MATDASSAVTTGDPRKMDAALKAKWVKALRSGKYRQERGRLTYMGGYCCLGVLCKVAKIDVGDIGQAYIHLESMTGNYGPFVDLNDAQRASFPEIADYIEKNL